MGEKNELTKPEKSERVRCEKIIGQGMKHFVDVGRALTTIRDQRLYRDTHATFQDYLIEQWDMSESRATQFIVAAEVVEEVEPKSLPLVNKTPLALPETPISHKPTPPQITSERVAREVAKAAPKGERAQVWQEAVNTAPKGTNGKAKVTAAHVQQVAAKRKAPPPMPDDIADDAPEWAKLSDVVEPILKEIEASRAKLRAALDAVSGEKKCRAVGAYFMSYLTIFGNIDQAVSHVRDNLPGAEDKEKPGYIPVRSVKMRKAGAK